MNLLSVGPSPVRSGGVGFYQRALAKEYSNHRLNFFFMGVDQVNHALENSQVEPVSTTNALLDGRVYDLVLKKSVYFGAVDPLSHISEPSAEKAFAEFIKKNNIHVVHFHASRPVSLIHVAKSMRCRVIISLHDYWFLCSLGFRVMPSRQLCEGSDGTKCAIFCDSFSRDQDEFVTRNSISSAIRGVAKYGLKRIFGSKYEVARKFLQNKTSNVIPAVTPVRSDGLISPVRAYSISDWNSRQKGLIETLNESGDLILSVSDIVTRRHVEAGIKREKIRTLNSGFEHATDSFFSLSRSVSRPIHSNCLKIVFVSPLYPEKGLHVLLDAVNKLLLKNKTNFQLDVYGKKEEWSRNYWEPLMRTLPMNVRFHGTFLYQDLPKIYSKADVSVVCPIMEDPSPRVVWEAMSAGVPVVASKQSGAADFITSGSNGHLFNSGDSSELADVLAKLIDDVSLISELQSKITPLKCMQKHALELIEIYKN